MAKELQLVIHNVAGLGNGQAELGCVLGVCATRRKRSPKSWGTTARPCPARSTRRASVDKARRETFSSRQMTVAIEMGETSAGATAALDL
ncbi:MAG: hypothetical protein E5V33_28425, partial [Mesorhizobium sp.]